MKPRRGPGVQPGMMILPLALVFLLSGVPSAADAGGGGAGSAGAPAPATAVPAGGGAEERPCAERIAARVQAHYESVERLEARFEQRMRSVAFGDSGMGSAPALGTVAFAKPGRMRWSYETPEPSLVVSNGRILWIYDPAAGEAQSMPVDEGFLSGAAFQFLLGEGDLLETFEVGAVDCEAPVVRLILRPRAASTYQLLEILADPETGAVRGTAVEDLFGNRTEVDFQDLRTNTRLPDDLFEFVPPEGVRVEAIQPLGAPPARPADPGVAR